MCPASAHHCQEHQQLVSFNNNYHHQHHHQQEQQQTISKFDSDFDDDIFLWDTEQESVPSLPSPQQPPPTPPYLVKTTGQFDCPDDCLCFKCSLINELLANLPCEPDCLCEKCRHGNEANQNDSVSDHAQPHVHYRDTTYIVNEVTQVQQLNEQPNIELISKALLSEQEDLSYYSKCTTLEYMPQIVCDDKDDEDVEAEKEQELKEEMKNSESAIYNDESSDFKTNLKWQTCSTLTKNYSNNEKASSSSPKSNECPLCKLILSSRASMLTHYRVKHLNWKPYYCKWTKCGFVSGYSKTVETHVQLRHLNKTVNIHKHNAEDYVGKRDDDQPPTDALLSEHLLKTGVSCPVTNYNTIEPRDTETSELCTCLKCSRTFARPDLLDNHLKSHGKSGYRCIWPNCGHFYAASISTMARRHVCHDHLGITDINPGFKDMRRAKKHLKLVNVKKPPLFSAPFAPNQPMTSFALTNKNIKGDDTKVDVGVGLYNASEHHSFDEPPVRINGLFHCRYKNCSKSFPGRSHILEHELIHTGKKPFGCTICKFVANRKSIVAAHFRTAHHGKKLYRCTVNNCGHSYSVHTDIVSHIRTKHHSGFKNLNLKSMVNKYVEESYLATI